MGLLLIFGFVAGAATAVSPCVVPVLPIVLSAGVTGGRRKPLGVVTGLVVSFTFALIALVYVIDALGLPNDLLRNIAIVVLAGFGIVLLIPSLAARVEGFGSRFVGRLGVKTNGGDGFWPGVGLGLSLGVLYAPCAGPILAGVGTFFASQSFNAGRLAVVLAYALGSAIVLYGIMLGGRKLSAPLARRSGAFQMAMGAIMLLVAFAMWQGYDSTFQSKVVANLPGFLVNPAEGIEKSGSAQQALAEIKGNEAHGIGLKAQEIESEGGSGGSGGGGGHKPIPTGTGNSKLAPPESRLTAEEEETVPLNDIGVAPEFTDTEDWFNTPGDRPLTMTGLRGKVVLIDFWTYSCINCIRTLPYLNAWNRRYAKDGLVIVGVHTPEFPFEREASNVEEAIKTDGIKYPVVQDNEDGTWNAYGNLYWPAEYFVDANGHVRYAHFGEGEYGEKEQVIRELLTEAGHPPGKERSGAHGIAAEPTVSTPESYLGSGRAENFTNGLITKGTHDFTLQQPGENELSYGGEWQITEQPVTAKQGARLALNFGARRVYLVLGSPGKPRRVKVLLDGKPIATADDGADVHNGYVKVTDERLYILVELPRVEHHVLELVPEEGVQGYAFTFG
ncbi:MAG TPA: cytochrome c biogenesis protein DipZ [Solirubrobacterales bacterium]|nr:cytochrome c biogenesis protein DipZ [Solirubrobacterales bacterium]